MPKLVAVNDAGMRIGEDHPKARYTNREIELVLELRDQGQGYGTIARKMEMPKRTVRDICNGRIRCQPVAGFKPMRME